MTKRNDLAVSSVGGSDPRQRDPGGFLAELCRLLDSLCGIFFECRLDRDGLFYFQVLGQKNCRSLGGLDRSSLQDSGRLLEKIEPEDRLGVLRSLGHSRDTLSVWRQRFRFHHGHRGRIWVQVDAIPQAGDDGAVVWTGFLFDVSERVRSECERVDREQDFRNLVNDANGVLFRTRPGSFSRFSELTEGIKRLVGINAEAFLALDIDWQEMVLAEDRGLRSEAIEEALAGSYRYSLEYRAHHKDGATIWVRESGIARAVDDDDSSVVIEGIMIDVTELKVSALAVREARMLLQAAMENMPSGVLIGSASSGLVRFVNKAASEALLGCANEVPLLMGCPLFDEKRPWRLFKKGGVEVGVSERPFYRACQQGEFVEPEEFLVVGLDRKSRWVSVSASPIMSEAGEVTAAIAVVSDITKKKAIEEVLERGAYYDVLTGLPNRVLLLERLQRELVRCQRNETCLAVLFVDLDDFKPVNDQYGHSVGDDVLIELAKRMRKSVREFDTVARLGGDEFVVLLTDLGGAEEVASFSERLVAAVATPIELAERVVQVGCSVGASIAYTTDSVSAEDLLTQADSAMYEAKAKGKNAWRLFEPSAGDPVGRSKDPLLEQVRESLGQDDFVLEYQPQVDLRSGELLSVEALLRLRSAGEGVLMPDAFIDTLMVDIDLVRSLSLKVIAQVLGAQARFNVDGLACPFTVNIHLALLEDEAFIEECGRLLQRQARFPLLFEFTERSVLSRLDVLTGRRGLLESWGVGVVVDHYGHGRWSMQDFRRLRVDQLKVCPSLVIDDERPVPDLPLLGGLAGTADSIGAGIGCVGLETDQHGRAVVNSGFTVAQGFVVSPARSIEDLSAWRSEWTPPQSWQQARHLGARGREILNALLLVEWCIEQSQSLSGDVVGRRAMLRKKAKRATDRVAVRRKMWSESEALAFSEIDEVAKEFGQLLQGVDGSKGGASGGDISRRTGQLLSRLRGAWDSLNDLK